MSIRYQMEPGMYSDVIFSYLLHFNIDTPDNLENFINPKKRAADLRYFRECLAKFTTPAEELCVFFEVAQKRSFAFTKVFGYLFSKHEFSTESVKGYLPDAQTLHTELYAFYGLNADDQATLVKEIAALEVSPAVKFHLLAMSVDATPYYDVLISSFEDRLQQMQAFYKENRAKIDQVKKTIKSQDIADYMLQCHGRSMEDEDCELTYSVMLVGKNAVRYMGGEQAFMILGFDYSARMAMLIGEAIQPDIVKIGKAISEEKRVTILQLLLAEKEITAQQLLQRLELSMTATHYHLEMLMQAGMLIARNEGRTIYYSLNREFFDRAPMIFQKYNSKDEFE